MTVAVSARFEGEKLVVTTSWGEHSTAPISSAQATHLEELMEQVQSRAAVALRLGRLHTLTLSFEATD